MSDPLKIAVLYDVWGEEETPTPRRRLSLAASARKKEKEDREEIFDALTKLGHEPFYYVIDGRPQTLHGLAKCGADLVFNLTESYAGDDTKEMNVAAYMDLIGLAYTGAGPHAHFLAQDKATAKKMFAFHEIHTPFFATAYRGNIDHAHDVKFPLIVKPQSEDGSIGIDAEAVVTGHKRADGARGIRAERVRLAGADRRVHRRPRDLCGDSWAATNRLRYCRWWNWIFRNCRRELRRLPAAM